MSLYSYHIFYFPFRWSLPSSANCLLSEQIDLNQIPESDYSMWERVQLDTTESKMQLTEAQLKDARELFGERQYFFDFVHPILYDMKGTRNPLIHHYERREPKSREVSYQIQVKDQTYSLKLDAMNLNLYSTGVGILAFFLANEREDQSNESAVLAINQFGRRIMPPHSGEFNPENRTMIASSIKILGLNGIAGNYEDSFDYEERGSGNKRGLNSVLEPPRFIKSLINDLFPDLDIVPIIDDRMLVNCWYGNNSLSEQVKNNAADEKSDFIRGDFWYKYVFVDAGDSPADESCRNDLMKERLLRDATYFRWQKEGTLFGVSRYSFVALSNTGWFGVNVLSMHMRTIYSRLFELIIVQRASMLRFSAEVTKVSALSDSKQKEIARRVGSLYKEYIRFVNQIYFRSVTLQDQGIELYEMLMNQFASQDQIKDLDGEIEELHRYVMLLVDQNRNENGETLNKLAAIFLPATVIAGILGMNRYCQLEAHADFWIHTGIIALATIFTYSIINNKIKRK